MKFTIALIASLGAVNASHSSAWWSNDWFWTHQKVVYEQKEAYCHYTEDYNDWSKPRFLFDLYQIGTDAGVESFKMSLQSYNVGADGDALSVASYGAKDCAGDATTVVDGDIWVKSRWH